MTTQATRGQWRTLTMGFDQALAKLPDALKQEGFGILTEVDLQQAFRTKLAVEFRRYRIFGACNPALALRALEADARVGVLLPCNVVLYENDAGGAVLGTVDPMQTLGAQGGAGLSALAAEVAQRLARVLQSF